MHEKRTGYSIQQMPESERPRERLIRHGVEVLSSAELLALILGSGTKNLSVLQLSQEIIAKFGTLEKLSDATIEELREVRGIGLAKAIQLRAAFNLGARLARCVAPFRMKIEHPIHVYHMVKEELENEKREQFVIIFQDNKGFVIGKEIVAIGTLTFAPVHPREVFYPAIRNKAASVIFVHNHPSGDLTPSKQDREITQKLIEVGQLLGIPVNDHIIVSERGYLSLREHGVVFPS